MRDCGPAGAAYSMGTLESFATDRSRKKGEPRVNTREGEPLNVGRCVPRTGWRTCLRSHSCGSKLSHPVVCRLPHPLWRPGSAAEAKQKKENLYGAYLYGVKVTANMRMAGESATAAHSLSLILAAIQGRVR